MLLSKSTPPSSASFSESSSSEDSITLTSPSEASPKSVIANPSNRTRRSFNNILPDCTGAVQRGVRRTFSGFADKAAPANGSGAPIDRRQAMRRGLSLKMLAGNSSTEDSESSSGEKCPTLARSRSSRGLGRSQSSRQLFGRSDSSRELKATMNELEDLVTDMEKLALALQKVDDPQKLLIKHMKLGAPKTKEQHHSHHHHRKHQHEANEQGPVAA